MRVTYSEIKRQQADAQLRQLKGETFPSQTAGKFAAEEKKEDTEHKTEIQCIITRADQWVFVCMPKFHTSKNDH